ncbi:MAG TPA: O-antigen ligase family protein [Pyrinomonadaceae bacterium]|nr:O-antigen ligase family protein [Pyrinomonadaceae bacterium]
MLRLLRRLKEEPQWLFAVLWPLALLAPFLPGLPRASNSGLTWRQESVIALLATITLALLFRRARSGGNRNAHFKLRRGAAVPAFAMTAFVVWSAVSLLWAENSFAALHYTATWGLYLLFFLLTVRVAESPRLLRASVASLAIVLLIISLANAVGHWTTTNSFIRQMGLGEPVAVSIPLFASLALRLRRRRAALLCGTTAVVGWLSMLQISERAPFLGASAGLLLVGACALASSRFRPRTPRRLALVVASFALATALQSVPSPFAETVHESIFTRLQATSPTEANTRVRFLYWGIALEMMRTHTLLGVGAGNYESAYPEARAQFAARHAGSTIVEMNEKYLTVGPHNEYLHVLSELGVVGFTFFLAFCTALAWAGWRLLRQAACRSPFAPGVVATMLAFAISSGASAISFRWLSSGLVFFFAAAVLTRMTPRWRDAARRGASQTQTMRAHSFARAATASGFVFALLTMCLMCAQAANVLLLAAAQSSADAAQAECSYRAALAWNPLDPATRFSYGRWLYAQRREREALSHLRYAVARGFNTSTCYLYLASAEEAAGEVSAAEATLAAAVRVYPRSVFLNVRHAAALSRAGREADADVAFREALLLNSREARGWYELINNDIDAAIVAARRDPSGVAMAGDLQPDDAVMAVIDENERRLGAQVTAKGWRARLRSGFLTQ